MIARDELEEGVRNAVRLLSSVGRSMSQACPAGDPCPATGCPACCPSYDPCGEKSCRNCNPKEGDMHVPEEAEMTEAAAWAAEPAKADTRGCGWVVRHATLETPDEYCGEEVPPDFEYCGKHQRMADEMVKTEARVEGETLPHAVTVISDKIREAYAVGNGPDNILAFPIRLLNELCNLATQYPYPEDGLVMLGPDVYAGPDEEVLVWKGQNYYKVAEPLQPEAPDPAKERRWARQEAMGWAVQLHSAVLRSGNAPDRSLRDTAQAILDWMNADN